MLKAKDSLGGSGVSLISVFAHRHIMSPTA